MKLLLLLFIYLGFILTKYECTGAAIKNQTEPEWWCCCTDPQPEVAVFNDEFYHQVAKSPVLINLCDLGNMTGEEFQTIAREITASELRKLNATDADSDAPDTASGGIPVQNFSGTLLLQVLANTASDYLRTKGLLNPGNAVPLARAYARSMVEACDDLQLWLSNPYLKALSFCYGIIFMFGKQGMFQAGNVPEIAKVFADQWRCIDRMQ